MSHIDTLQTMAATTAKAQPDTDLSQAEAVFASLRAQYPAQERGWIGGAQALGDAGKLDEMDALLAEAVRRFPQNPEVAKEYARAAARLSRPDESVDRWVEAVRRFPNDPAMHAGLGTALATAARFDDADATLLAAIKRFPTDFALRSEYARCAEMRREPEAAFTRWQEAGAAFPQNTLCIVGAAMALCNQRQTAEAETLLAEAIQRFPPNQQLLSSAAFVARLRRNWPAALQYAYGLLFTAPDRATGHEVRIQALRELGRTEEAEAALKTARQNFPNSVQLAMEEARTASARGDADAALAAWRIVRAQTNAPAEPAIEISDLLIRHKKFEEAESLLSAELERFPGAVGIAVRFGMMANRRRAWPEAIARWQALDAQFPKNTQILGGLAEATWMAHDHPALVELLDRIISLEPNNIAAAILYARYEMRQNRAGDAVRRLVAAEKAWPGNRNILAQLNDARMQAMVEDIDPVPGDTAAPASALEKPEADLFAHFESLGSGCEFGLLQRRAGSEPIGLLRWANITPRGLTEALERKFEGIGDIATTAIRAVGDTYLLADRTYDIGMQTFISPTTEAAETLLPKLCRRQRYLARLLMENLAEASRILIYKLVDTMTEQETQRLWQAVKSYGDNALLIVKRAGDDHPAGSFWAVEDGLMIGTVAHFSNTDPDLTSWTKICTAAREAWADVKQEQVILSP